MPASVGIPLIGSPNQRRCCNIDRDEVLRGYGLCDSYTWDGGSPPYGFDLHERCLSHHGATPLSGTKLLYESELHQAIKQLREASDHKKPIYSKKPNYLIRRHTRRNHATQYYRNADHEFKIPHVLSANTSFLYNAISQKLF